MASLEGGEDCVVLASGVAALSGLFFALLNKGDHVIFSSVTYIAVYRLLNELLNNKFGVETTIVDTTDPANVEAAIRPNTKLIHIETPGNPTLMISDISAIAEIAHRHGALLSVDNTFASPFNQHPIELGADFAVESLTKYINGHGDSMGGAIIGKTEYLDQIRAQSQVNLGGTISPFNAWLIMRGSVTLPLRMRQHNENAMAVAQWLEKQPCVSFVAYPGLENHKGHEVAKKQMAPGFGGVPISLKTAKAKRQTITLASNTYKINTPPVSQQCNQVLSAYRGRLTVRYFFFRTPPSAVRSSRRQ